MSNPTELSAKTDSVADTPTNVVVSVVVPHFNDLRGLDRCLTALGRQTYPSNLFEIVVADNGSPQGADAVERVIDGRAQLIVAKERGAGPARNAAAAMAKGQYFAFTDSDCIPEPQWLAEGLAALRQYDFVGGRMNVLTSDPAAMSAVEAFETVFAFPNEAYVKNVGFTVTANLVCPRATFEAVGGFRAVLVSEDIDWCHRARDAGFSIGYAPEAAVGHPARTTWDELTRKWRRTNLERFGLTIEQKYGRLRWLARTLLLPASAIAHTPKILLSSRLRGWRNRSRALGVLYRLRIWRFLDSLALLLASR